MATITQFIQFMNQEEMPGEMELHVRYTHLEITPELKELRGVYRRNLRKQSAGQIELGI